MIITISGMPGSGKSTVAELVAKKLNYKHHSIGCLMRRLAKKKSKSLLELGRIAEADRKVDEELDNAQVELGKGDDFVLDSRLGFHFIPESFKVFLKVSDDEAAKRVFADKRAEEKENITVEDTVESVKTRVASEAMRYKKYYGINPFDESQYDLLIDTTDISAEEAAGRIIAAVK